MKARRAMARLLSVVMVLITVFSNNSILARADAPEAGTINVVVEGNGQVQFEFYEDEEGKVSCPSGNMERVTESGSVSIPGGGEHGAKTVLIKAWADSGYRQDGASGMADNDIFNPAGKLMSISPDSGYTLSVKFVEGEDENPGEENHNPPSVNAGDIKININRCSGTSVASYKIGDAEWIDITNGLTLRKSNELASVGSGTVIYFKATPDASQILDTNDQNWYGVDGINTPIDLDALLAGSVSITYNDSKSYEVQIAFDGKGTPGPSGSDGTRENSNVEIHSMNGNEDRINAIEVKLGESDWTNYTNDSLKNISEETVFKLRFKMNAGYSLDGFSLRYYPFGEGSPVDYKYEGPTPSESDILSALLSDAGYEITFKPQADSANSDGESSLGDDSACLRIEYRTAVSFVESVVVNVFFQQKSDSSYGDWRVIDGRDTFVDGVGANEVRFRFNGNEYGGQGDPERLGYGVRNDKEAPLSVMYKSTFGDATGTLVTDIPEKYDRFTAGGHATGTEKNTFYMSDEDGLVDDVYIDLNNNGIFEDAERISPQERNEEWGTYNYYERQLDAANTCNVLVKYHLSSRVSLKWSYTCDPNEDFYVNHGKIYIEKIKRGEDVLFEAQVDANHDLELGEGGIPKTIVNTMGGDYSVDSSNGEVFVEVGDEVTVRLIPTYGYQVKEAKLNGWQVLTPNETRSSFTFIVGGNLHLAGNFVSAVDVISNESSAVLTGSIVGGANASDTGVLGLSITDNASYANADAAKAAVGDGTAESVATLDMELESLVSKGNGEYWEDPITEFDNNINVQITLGGENISANEGYVVVREHDGIVEKLGASFNAGVLTIPTNKFSTYSIYKVHKEQNEHKNKHNQNTLVISPVGKLTYGDSNKKLITTGGSGSGAVTFSAPKDNGVVAISGDTLTIVGAGTVTISAVKASTSEYKEATASLDITVDKKELTPSISGSAEKKYDGTKVISDTNTLSIELSGIVGSDDVAATAETMEYAAITAASNVAVNATGITLTGSKAGNYTLATTTATANVGNINKATAIVSFANLNQVSNAITGATATITPASKDAVVTIEYKDTDEWVTTVPTTAGEYAVRAYVSNGGTNIETQTAVDAVMDTFKITKFDEPGEKDNSGNTSSEETTDTKPADTTTESAPSTEEKQPEVVAPSTEEKQPEVVTPSTEEKQPEIVTPPSTEEKKSGVTAPVKVEKKQPEVKTPTKTEEKTSGEIKKESTVTSEATLKANTKEAWNSVVNQILESLTNEVGSEEKSEVKVKLGNTTEIPKVLFEEIKGKDVDVVLEMSDGISWTINGMDVTANDLLAIDLEVKYDNGDIPTDKTEDIAGDKKYINLSLTHDGEFGFKATLSIEIGEESEGLYANLYYYNPETGEYEFVSASSISANGKAAFDFVHASDYTIVIDDVAATATNNAVVNETVNNVEEVASLTINQDDDSEMAVEDAKKFNWSILLIVLGAVAVLAIIALVVIKTKKD